MKRLSTILVAFLLLTLSSNTYAKSGFTMNPDSLNLRMYMSLFHEDHKNKSYATCLEPGWVVVNNNPAPFLKNRIFEKMEEALLFLYNDTTNVVPDDRKMYLDTLMHLYDKAAEFHKVKAPYFKMRKAYMLQTAMQATPDKFIPLYEDAFDNDSSLDPFYKDRLGLAYMQNMNDENDYQLKAIEIYNKLQELQPDNDTWNQRLMSLSGGDISKLIEIKKKSWDINPDNLEKAWDYANTCVRAKEFEKAIEPLRFLVSKAPNVINYWKQLANAEEKIGENNKAIDAYKKLMELDPNFKDAYVNIAIIHKNLKQLSVARTYLIKAQQLDEEWDYPIFIEAQLYEESARQCFNSKGKLDLIDKACFELAADYYRKAARLNGTYSSIASARAGSLSSSIPTKEEYFFQGIAVGTEMKLNSGCYAWIGKSVRSR